MPMIGDFYEYNDADLPQGIRIGKLIAHGSYGYVHECATMSNGTLRSDLVIKCVPLDSDTLSNLGHDKFDFQDPVDRRNYTLRTPRIRFEQEVKDSRKLSGKVAPALIASFFITTHSEEHRKAGLDHMITMGCLVFERLEMTLCQLKADYSKTLSKSRKEIKRQLISLINQYWDIMGGPYDDLHDENVMAKLTPAGFQLYLIDMGSAPKQKPKTRAAFKEWEEDAEKEAYS